MNTVRVVVYTGKVVKMKEHLPFGKEFSIFYAEFFLLKIY